MTTHLPALLRLHPRGPWNLDDGSLCRHDLEVVAHVIDDAAGQNAELLLELLPDRTTALITSWERVYGLTRIAGKTLAKRRAAVLARRRFLPDFRPATIEDVLGTLTGLTVDVVEPGAFRCDDPASLCDAEEPVIDGAFVFFVEFSESSARSESLSRDEIQEAIDDLKPAHTYGAVRCDDFLTEDPWSLCDMDLLGA